MTNITLRQFVDDIYLIIRNNNISESEDLSRKQVILWIKAWKQHFIKQRIDQQKREAGDGVDIEDVVDDIYIRETGPLELEPVPSYDDNKTYVRRTVAELKDIYNNDEDSILAVHDQNGENIQYMNHVRRHYHNFRKYTWNELTASFDDNRIYIRGNQDCQKLKYIWVKALYETEDDWDNKPSEDDIHIPAWLVPMIKDAIMKNELAFMLQRPSDDSNNSTLASVKPHGPQDDEE